MRNSLSNAVRATVKTSNSKPTAKSKLLKRTTILKGLHVSLISQPRWMVNSKSLTIITLSICLFLHLLSMYPLSVYGMLDLTLGVYWSILGTVERQHAHKFPLTLV